MQKSEQHSPLKPVCYLHITAKNGALIKQSCGSFAEAMRGEELAWAAGAVSVERVKSDG